MAKTTIPEKTYDLIPSQQSMAYMLKYSIHKSVIQIPIMMAVHGQLDFDILQKAFKEEVKRNDCLRIRFYKDKGETRQYFLPSYDQPDVEIKHFASNQEMNDFFNLDAQKPVPVYKSVPYRLYFFSTSDGRTGVYINTSHLIMDAYGVIIFYADLFSVYHAMAAGKEMPAPMYKYEDRVIKELAYLKDEKKMKRDEEFYKEFWIKDGMPFYAGVHGHNILDKERKKKKDPELRIPAAYDALHDKCDMLVLDIPQEETKKIADFCINNEESPENVIEMGFRAHASKVNYDTDDTFSLQLCSRRVTYKDKKMGGCLCQPLAVRAIIPDTMTYRQGVKELDEVRNTLYRHMNYPYITSYAMEREIYHLSMFQAPSFMMFTWLPLPDMSGDKFPSIDFEGFNIGRYAMPLYTFAYPVPSEKVIKIRYLYRTSRISENVIRTLHANALKAIIDGIDNPEKTMGEIKAGLKDVNEQ
jgi:hypothetical protein